LGAGETPHNKNINPDIIKAVTVGNWVTGKQLYKDLFKFMPYAKSFLVMNEPPRIIDQSHGMWRRIWVIEFPRKFEEHEMDRELESSLSLELSGIFNWALEGYKRLSEKKFALSESGSMKNTKSEYRSSIESVRAFVQDNIISSNNETGRI
jgi:putative DNA primase/helicase